MEPLPGIIGVALLYSISYCSNERQYDFIKMAHRQPFVNPTGKVVQCTKIITKQTLLRMSIYQPLPPLF